MLTTYGILVFDPPHSAWIAIGCSVYARPSGTSRKITNEPISKPIHIVVRPTTPASRQDATSARFPGLPRRAKPPMTLPSPNPSRMISIGEVCINECGPPQPVGYKAPAGGVKVTSSTEIDG